MSDLGLYWHDTAADLAILDDDLGGDSGLRTAVMLSLFLDAPAGIGESGVDDDGLPRGWWGDEFSEVEGDQIGSLLWRLDRAKQSPNLAGRAVQIVRNALAWMIEDRVASDVDVSAEVKGDGIALRVVVHRPERDPVSYRFFHVWSGVAQQAALGEGNNEE